MAKFPVLLVACMMLVASASKPFTFLGKSYTRKEWNDIKAYIHCMTTRGEWTNTGRLSGMLYQSPCHHVRYIHGHCEVTALRKSMVGMDYTWKNSNETCSFPGRPDIAIEPFNRAETCRLMGNNNVLVLGDSISDEFFFSLGSALLQSTADRCWESNEMKATFVDVRGSIPYQQFNTKTFGCGESVLSYLRHDYFVMSKIGDPYKYNTDPINYGAGWPETMRQLNTNLLIVNRGAHFVEDDIVLTELNNTLNALRASYGDKLSIIFRSTAPGHDDYDRKRYLPPLKNAAEAKLTSYKWARYEQQNKLVRQLLHHYHEDVLYMDVYPSMVLRSDGHAGEDGLHYCIPGPIDQWVTFFYNILNVLDKV